MNKRIQWITYKGQKIFQVDVRSISREEQIETAQAYAELLEKEPDGSVRVLVLAGEFEFHPDVISKVKAYLLQVQPKVKRSALVGVDGILRVAFEGFFTLARFLGMTMNEERGKPFDKEEDAKEWLTR